MLAAASAGKHEFGLARLLPAIQNRRKQTSKSEFVFPGRRRGKHITDLAPAVEKLLTDSG